MTYAQASSLVAILAAAFPRQRLSAETAAVFVDSLHDLDFETTKQAVRRLIAEQDFPPSIAQIRHDVCQRVVGLPMPDHAWQLVCQRWGERNGLGDKSIELPSEVRTALDAAGIDPYRYWTSEDRHWLRRAFLDVYAAMLQRLVRAKNLGDDQSALDTSTTLDAKLGLPVAEASVSDTRLGEISRPIE